MLSLEQAGLWKHYLGGNLRKGNAEGDQVA
jgi:hypothetical protein